MSEGTADLLDQGFGEIKSPLTKKFLLFGVSPRVSATSVDQGDKIRNGASFRRYALDAICTVLEGVDSAFDCHLHTIWGCLLRGCSKYCRQAPLRLRQRSLHR